MSTTSTYRINSYKMSEEKRKKIKKYLQSYSCMLNKEVKSYMEFIADDDFDIEGMLATEGIYISVKKLPD